MTLSTASALVFSFRGQFELCVVVHDDVARFLFDLTNNLALCGGRERVLLISEVFHRILCRITANQIQAKDVVMQSVTFADGALWRDEQHFRETETFGATVMMFSSGSTWVFSVVSYRSRELCVVVNVEEARFLCDIRSNLPLCEGSRKSTFGQ